MDRAYKVCILVCKHKRKLEVMEDKVSKGEDMVSKGEDMASKGEDMVSKGEDMVSKEEDMLPPLLEDKALDNKVDRVDKVVNTPNIS